MSHPPPQDVLVGRQFINGLDGREAVAQESIAEGELVLVSTPYAVAMIASSAPTALMCAAKAVEDAATDHRDVENEAGKKYNAKHKKQRVSENPNRQPPPAALSSSTSASVGSGGPTSIVQYANPTAPLDVATTFGLKDRPGMSRKNGPQEEAVFRLKHPTFCASCFQAIPSGTILENRSRLQDTAVEISVEQMLLQREREAMDQEKHGTQSHANEKETNHQDGGEDEGEDGAEGEGKHGDAAALTAKQKKELKKQKKPAKSAAMKKDGVVALKQRLAAAAAEELELFVESYLMEKTKRDRVTAAAEEGEKEKLPQAQTPPTRCGASPYLIQGGAFWNGTVASISCWDPQQDMQENPVLPKDEGQEGSSQLPTPTPLGSSSSSCAGCEHCGVLMFCSPRCWHAHRDHHLSSGECVVLRRVHFPLMQTYFAPSAKALAGTLGHNGGLVPGTEPSRWMSRCNADRELEMHSLLLAALVGGAAAADGRAERLKDREMAHVLTPSTEESAGAAHPVKTTMGEERHRGTTSEAASPTTATAASSTSPAAEDVAPSRPPQQVPATTASLQPKEVTTIEELRRALDAAPAVEVLDAMPHAISASPGAASTESGAVSERIRVVEWDSREDEATEVFGPPHENKDHPHEENETKKKSSQHAAAQSVWHRQTVRVSRYEDVSLLVTNLSVLPRDRHSLYRCYWRQYLKLIAPLLSFCFLADGDVCAATSESVEVGPSLIIAPHRRRTGGIWLSESYFNRIAAACQCNSFGVFSPADSCIASGLYPEASFFNHSCAPNLCRVMRPGRVACFYALRPIEKGEGLTICYTEVAENNTAERRRLLLDGYRFFCHCPRCSGQVGSQTPTVIYLCEKCEAKGYLRPLRQRKSSTADDDGDDGPSSSAVATKARSTICSVCRQTTTLSQTV